MSSSILDALSAYWLPLALAAGLVVLALVALGWLGRRKPPPSAAAPQARAERTAVDASPSRPPPTPRPAARPADRPADRPAPPPAERQAARPEGRTVPPPAAPPPPPPAHPPQPSLQPPPRVPPRPAPPPAAAAAPFIHPPPAVRPPVPVPVPPPPPLPPPPAPTPRPPPPPVAAAQPPASVAPAAAALPLLLVDDSAVVRAKLRKLLEGAGHAVVVARDGVEALECLDRARFALLITDLEMPNMNGAELIAAVHGRPDLAGLDMLAITGHEELQSHLQQYARLRGVLRKPWNDAELLSQIQTLLPAVQRH